jgi:hypothetical protein
MIPVPHPMSESADEFASLRTALELEIKPKGIVEQIYVDDIAAIVWEIRRLRRCKPRSSHRLPCRLWAIREIVRRRSIRDRRLENNEAPNSDDQLAASQLPVKAII